MDEVHMQFIDLVKEARGWNMKKLTSYEEDELFNAEIWTGARACELGLVDGTALLPEEAVVDGILKSGFLEAEYRKELEKAGLSIGEDEKIELDTRYFGLSKVESQDKNPFQMVMQSLFSKVGFSMGTGVYAGLFQQAMETGIRTHLETHQSSCIHESL